MSDVVGIMMRVVQSSLARAHLDDLGSLLGVVAVLGDFAAGLRVQQAPLSTPPIICLTGSYGLRHRDAILRCDAWRTVYRRSHMRPCLCRITWQGLMHLCPANLHW